MENTRHLRWLRGGALAGALGLLGALLAGRHAGLGFFDASEFSLHIRAGGIAHAPGYPLYILLGQALNAFTRDPFLAQHGISLGALAFASFALYRTFARRFQADPWAEPAALATALLLLSSFYLRKYALLPEVFTLNVALFAGLGWALEGWWHAPRPRALFMVFLFYGLGLAHHHTLALTVPAALALFWQKRRSCSARGALAAAAGFGVGAAPIAYLCLPPHSPATISTYYFIQNASDLLFVLLRKGYGTFSLSVLRPQTPLADLFALTGRALLKNFNVAAPAAFAPLALRGARRELRADPMITYAGITLLVFGAWFLPRSAIPLDTATYRNTFLRFVTIPAFLSLYFAFHGLRRALPALAQALGSPARGAWAALVLVSLANIPYRGELRFRDYDLLDEHVRQGYAAIFAGADPGPSGIAPGWRKCALFVRADTLVFSLRYYNQFSATRRCFVFTPVSFSGQFRARPEEALQRQAMGDDYAAALTRFRNSPFELTQFFFGRLKAMGYRLYLFYQPDFVVFHDSPFGYRPAGNLLELVTDRDPPLSPDKLLSMHESYLNGLDAYFSRHRAEDFPTEIVDDTVSSGLAQNLLEYRRFNAEPPAGLAEHARRTEQRAQAMLGGLGTGI